MTIVGIERKLNSQGKTTFDILMSEQTERHKVELHKDVMVGWGSMVVAGCGLRSSALPCNGQSPQTLT